MANGSVTVQIQEGSPASVTWVQGMTVQQALEGVFNQQTAVGQFSYALAYSGTLLGGGYVVTMINSTVDTGGSIGPFFYWVFSVNGTPSATGGVNTTTLNSGDAVVFTFQEFKPSTKSKKSALTVKHDMRAKAPKKAKG